jgi:hypothetical protein
LAPVNSGLPAVAQDCFAGLAGTPFRPPRRIRDYRPFACPISHRIPGPIHFGSPPGPPEAPSSETLEDGIRSLETQRDGLQIMLGGAIVGDSYFYGRLLTRRAERTDWPA